WRRDQHAAVPEGAVLQLVPVPEAGQRQTVLFPAQIPGLLAPALLLPYVVTLHRDQAAPLDQRFAEHGLAMQELGLGGERRPRSEERRVGKGGRGGGWAEHDKE